MIEPDPTAFPNNAVNALQNSLAAIDPSVDCLKRPLTESDVEQAMGVFAVDWTPDDTSYELRGTPHLIAPGASFPTISNYFIHIQALCRDADEERGIATHSAFAGIVRRRVAHDPALRIALSQLAHVPAYGPSEHAQLFRITRQTYRTVEVSGTWLYMSTTEFNIQTETR